MKKYISFLMMAAALVACSREEQPETPANYTLSVKANKGDLTRALALSNDGKTLNASWAEGEQVIVYFTPPSSTPFLPGIAQLIGTLSPTDISSDGLSCTLSGDLDAEKIASAGGINNGDKLQLVFPGSLGSNGTADQDGTLETIQNYYDRLHAEVTISAVNGTSITASDAEFVNDRSIVRFILKDATGTPITPTFVSVTATPTGYTPDSPIEFSNFASTYTGNGGCFFVALGGLSGGDFSGDITINATASGDVYEYTKSDISFTAGKFYSITVKMRPRTIIWDADKLDSEKLAIYISGDWEEYNQADKNSDGITVALNTGSEPGVVYFSSDLTIGSGTGTITFGSSVGNISKIEINHSGEGQWAGNGDAGLGWPDGQYGYYEASGGTFIWNESPSTSVTLWGSGHLYGITSIVFTFE